MGKSTGTEGPATVRLGRRERMNWSGNANRLLRGTERLAMMKIHAM
jgi:hypothetical protein